MMPHTVVSTTPYSYNKISSAMSRSEKKMKYLNRKRNQLAKIRQGLHANTSSLATNSIPCSLIPPSRSLLHDFTQFNRIPKADAFPQEMETDAKFNWDWI